MRRDAGVSAGQRIARLLFLIGLAIAAYLVLSIFDQAARADDGAVKQVTKNTVVEDLSDGGKTDPLPKVKDDKRSAGVTSKVLTPKASDSQVSSRRVSSPKGDGRKVLAREAAAPGVKSMKSVKEQVRKVAAPKESGRKASARRVAVSTVKPLPELSRRAPTSGTAARQVAAVGTAVLKGAVPGSKRVASRLEQRGVAVEDRSTALRRAPSAVVGDAGDVRLPEAEQAVIDRTAKIVADRLAPTDLPVRVTLPGTVPSPTLTTAAILADPASALPAVTEPVLSAARHALSVAQPILVPALMRPVLAVVPALMRPVLAAVPPLTRPVQAELPAATQPILAALPPPVLAALPPPVRALLPAQARIPVPPAQAAVPPQPDLLPAAGPAARPVQTTTPPGQDRPQLRPAPAPRPAPLRHPADHSATAGHTRDAGGSGSPAMGTVPSSWWREIVAARSLPSASVAALGRSVRYAGPPS